jgi:hypothetical protein
MAKNATIRAIIKAGFNANNFPNLQEYILVTEPEAAAVYTARTLKQELGGEFLRVSSSFLRNKSSLLTMPSMGSASFCAMLAVVQL